MLNNRKANRLKDWDYSTGGWYFVTIGTRLKKEFFGGIEDSRLDLNGSGLVAKNCWEKISEIYKNVILDVFVVMPNHVHGIIWIREIKCGPVSIVGTGHCPVRTDQRNNYGLLSKVINGYKNAVTKEIRNSLGIKDFGWHRSFYDEIVWDKKSLERIRKYIINNPRMWFRDRNNIC